MMGHIDLIETAKKISEEKRMMFVAIRQDKHDGHVWMDMGSIGGCADSVFSRIRKLQELIPDWDRSNPVVGIVKCVANPIDE